MKEQLLPGAFAREGKENINPTLGRTNLQCTSPAGRLVGTAGQDKTSCLPIAKSWHAAWKMQR